MSPLSSVFGHSGRPPAAFSQNCRQTPSLAVTPALFGTEFESRLVHCTLTNGEFSVSRRSGPPRTHDLLVVKRKGGNFPKASRVSECLKRLALSCFDTSTCSLKLL
jgi:hypothetical protein